jgi:RNA 2',3'-cyclic 3'-phosphodiesterase
MRCFIGLPLPQSYQQGLEEIITTCKPWLRSRVSWTRPGNWHLTLVFLGEVAADRLNRLSSALDGATGQCFRMQAQGGGFFADQRRTASRPRVIWVGIGAGSRQVAALAQMVGQCCELHGFPGLRRDFAPHLTAARIKQAWDDPWARVLSHLQNVRWPAITVDRMVLWESRLLPEGPHYQRVREFPLAAGSMDSSTLVPEGGTFQVPTGTSQGAETSGSRTETRYSLRD